MGQQWTEDAERELPRILSYSASPIAKQCTEILAGLETIRDSLPITRHLIGLLIDKRKTTEAITKHGATCQIIASGDARPLALSSAIRAHDRARCSWRLGDADWECTGASASGVLGTQDWEEVLTWLGAPTNTDVHSEFGTLRLGACDDAIASAYFGPKGDDISLDVDFYMFGNAPPFTACAIAEWREVGALDSIRRQFAVAIDPNGDIFVLRTDDGRSVRRRVGKLTRPQAFSIHATFPKIAGEIAIPGSNASEPEPWPLEQNEGNSCDTGGASMMDTLFPERFGFGDNPRRFGLLECTSPTIAQAESGFVRCQNDQPATGPHGLEMWDGSENEVGEIVRINDAQRRNSSLLIEGTKIESGAVEVFQKSSTATAPFGVLSVFVSGPTSCRIRIGGREQPDIPTNDPKWRRVQAVLGSTPSISLESWCDKPSIVELRHLQWEKFRITASPPILRSQGRNCRGRFIGIVSVSGAHTRWPVLFPSLNYP